MIGNIIYEMIDINGADTRRINHALKVLGVARCIAQLEGLDAPQVQILEAAAVLHDIGIRYCEDNFGKCTGSMQEQYGPKIAEEILIRLGMEELVTERVLYLIAHHHTYNNIDGIDYQILIEADFLVNYDEGDMNTKAFKTAYDKCFKTDTGKRLARRMFGIC